MKTFVVSLLILASLLYLAESVDDSAEEVMKELLEELKSLDGAKNGRTGASLLNHLHEGSARGTGKHIYLPPGAHEVPSTDADRESKHLEKISRLFREPLERGTGEPIHLPPGAHEVPSADVDRESNYMENNNNSTSSDSDSVDDPSDDDDDDDDDDEGSSNENGDEKMMKKLKKELEKKKISREIFKHLARDSSSLTKNVQKAAVNPCGVGQPLVISDDSGSILSPGFQNSRYADEMKCSWKFVAPPGKVVKITFQVMEIEWSGDCTYDSVQIWDVKNNRGVNLGKYCGRTIPMELLKSTGTIMFVYFLTDVTGNNGRFSFQWDMVDPQPPEPSDLTCGRPRITPDTDSRIVNGKPAKPFSWPWQISLRLVVNNAQYHICGGSIISSRVVATAAHCMFDEYHKRFPVTDMRVVTGDYDQKTSSDGKTQTPAIKDIIVHQYYDPLSSSSPYDISIILLKEDIVFNDHVITVCLPRESPSIYSLCYATGWGDTKGTGDKTILNQVRLPIVPNTKCSSPTFYGRLITSTVLCGGYDQGGKDACQGDSGGPYVCYNELNKRWYLQGITSWGDGCGKPNRPGVYTRVNSYLDWIYAKSGVVS